MPRTGRRPHFWPPREEQVNPFNCSNPLNQVSDIQAGNLRCELREQDQWNELYDKIKDIS